MVNRVNVSWSPEAQKQFNKIILYLLEHFGLPIAERFTEEVSDLINRIRENRRLCPSFSHKIHELHRCVIRKQASLTYMIAKKNIYIVSVFDNRTDHPHFA